MHQETIKAIVAEFGTFLPGRVLGKIFQLSSASFAIDLRHRGEYLFLSAEPSSPRIYLISRAVRELEKQTIPLDEFGHALRINLTGATLVSVTQDEFERVVRFEFSRREETGEKRQRTLVAQLTGRSANLLLLDEKGDITHALRSLNGAGQRVGETYTPPPRHHSEISGEPLLARGNFASLSAAAANHYLEIAAAGLFDARLNTARARLRRDAVRLEKLADHLHQDLSAHGDAEQHKRVGDLLLANIATAIRNGNTVSVQDFFADNVPTVQIEIDASTTLQAEAAKYFARYSKSKRAAETISTRLREIAGKLSELKRRQTTLDQIASDRDELALEQFRLELTPPKKSANASKTERPATRIPGTRRYLSSDGYATRPARNCRIAH